MSNIIIKVTIETEGPSEFGSLKESKQYTVAYLSAKYDCHDEIVDAKTRTLKLINRAVNAGGAIMVEAEWFSFEQPFSRTHGTMWLNAHRWGDHYDVYEHSEWQSETFKNPGVSKADTKKALTKGLNNLLMTVTNTMAKSQDGAL